MLQCNFMIVVTYFNLIKDLLTFIEIKRIEVI